MLFSGLWKRGLLYALSLVRFLRETDGELHAVCLVPSVVLVTRSWCAQK